MNTPDTRTKCNECGAYQPGHSPLCSQQTPEQWIHTATLYYRSWLGRVEETNKRLQEAAVHHERVKAQATFWQGKYAIVKQENNKLRAKLKFGQPMTCVWQDINQAERTRTPILLHGRFELNSPFTITVIGHWHTSMSGDIDKGWWVSNALPFHPTHFCELLADPK